MKALHLLTRHVAVAKPDDTLLEAAQRMREEHVGVLVVIDPRGTRRLPIGMLTDRDIVVGVVAKAAPHLTALTVADVMTRDIVTATADEEIFDILQRMRSFGVRRVPIVDAAGALQGIVSGDDIVGGLSKELAEAATLLSWQRRREPARRP